MSFEVVNAPAIINVTGKTKTDRQLSVITQASSGVKMALANAGGKVGKTAREGIAGLGLGNIAKMAAWPRCDYRPVAEYIAARTGEPIVVSNRSAFEALPDMMECRVMKAKMAKGGGFVTDKKTGALKPGATLALAMELKAICIELVEVANEISAENKAKHAAEKAATAALA